MRMRSLISHVVSKVPETMSKRDIRTSFSVINMPIDQRTDILTRGILILATSAGLYSVEAQLITIYTIDKDKSD